jgi:hypothetical protein
MMLRSQTAGATTSGSSGPTDDNSIVATVHRTFDREHGSKLFINPLTNRSDAVTFAQAEFFLPRPRYRCCPWMLETPEAPVHNTDDWPRQWDSFNQTWSARLIPANEAAVLTILQSPPPAPADGMRPLRLDGVTPLDVERVNTH